MSREGWREEMEKRRRGKRDEKMRMEEGEEKDGKEGEKKLELAGDPFT